MRLLLDDLLCLGVTDIFRDSIIELPQINLLIIFQKQVVVCSLIVFVLIMKFIQTKIDLNLMTLDG